MFFLEETQIKALYRHQNTPDWVGDTHMTCRWFERVPFTVEGQRYLVSFSRSNYINGFGSYNNMLFSTTDGGVFIPKREHRHVSLHTIASDGAVLPLGEDDVPPELAKRFIDGMLAATLKYQRDNNHINQYFFVSEGNLGAMVKIRAELYLKDNGQTMSVTFYDELVAPVMGFSLLTEK
ncbi:conserved hypothetical protein [Vibrio owensii]|uniref:hypothetical protein n=1 Tax=Vibrio owensii TaxID=696485 RepID=UPI002895A9E5|nr:conserved hypothetical protein [Vibrio owensii]CAH1593265.1 conserved hypothetical protein [Vibrio owensii]